MILFGQISQAHSQSSQGNSHVAKEIPCAAGRKEIYSVAEVPG